MRDDGTCKGVPRARRVVVGVFVLVGVVVAAAAFVPVASLGTPKDASTSAVSGGESSTRCVADPAHAPKMTDREIATVLKYVTGAFDGATWRDGEAIYLEWGGGGSTSAFGTRARLTHTVEHAPRWCVHLSSWEELKCLSRRGAWELFCHDSGVPLTKWGYPDDGVLNTPEPSRETGKPAGEQYKCAGRPSV